MKSVPKTTISFNFYDIPSFTIWFYGARQKSKYNINIKTAHPISVTYFSNLLSFDSRMFIFIVFCISSNKLSSISCGICLSFKNRHLELFCIIIIQLSSTGIFLGLRSRDPPSYFTEQLFFLHSCNAFNHSINKYDQEIRQVKNQIIKHQIRKKN